VYFNSFCVLCKEYFEYAIAKDQLLKIISETEVHEQVYNSNAIENSTLTIEETEKILLQIDLDRYVSEREIYEAINLARVTEYIDNNARDKALSSDMMLFLHKILISNIDNDIAGRFREGDEYYRAFREFNISEKTEIMEQIIYRALINSYYKRLAYLKGLKIVTLGAYAKAHNLSHPNLINKAKRQTVPAYIEKDRWMIGG